MLLCKIVCVKADVERRGPVRRYVAASVGLASKCLSRMLRSSQLSSFESLEVDILFSYVDMTSYLSRHRPISHLQHAVGRE